MDLPCTLTVDTYLIGAIQIRKANQARRINTQLSTCAASVELEYQQADTHQLGKVQKIDFHTCEHDEEMG